MLSYENRLDVKFIGALGDHKKDQIDIDIDKDSDINMLLVNTHIILYIYRCKFQPAKRYIIILLIED